MMNVRSTANTSSKATLWKVFILILAIIVNVVLASRLLWGPQSLVSYRELASQYAELLKERDGFDAKPDIGIGGVEQRNPPLAV